MIDKTIKIPFDVLTPAVKEVAEICDLDTALSVVAHFGGCRFYVPTKWRPEHELNIIGEDRAKILIERMGGGELSMAEGFSFDAKKTRFWVRKDNGISVKFFYLKQKNSNSLEIQSILVRLSIKQHTLFVDYDNVETTFLIKI